MELQNALTQTLYAQLQEEAAAYSVSIFEQGVFGSPYRNKSGGHDYIYWQIRRPDGSFKRKSLGRDCPETQSFVERLLDRKKTAIESIEALKTTTRAYIGSGGMGIESAHFRIMESLACGGLFSKGLVLVGSHAFAAIGNMLGVRWGGNLKTTDMDFARPSGIALAIPDSGESINVPASIKEFDPTFFEVPMLNNKHPSTSLMSRKTKIKIDFLTVQKTGIDFAPHYYSDLAIAADPLRYMDYLLGGKSCQGLVIGAYAIPVNLPDPARFSIHKLVIAQERSLNFETKSAKDIRQASEGIEALVEIGRESDLQRALSDLLATGSKKPLENLKKSVARMNGKAKAVLLGEMQKALA